LFSDGQSAREALPGEFDVREDQIFIRGIAGARRFTIDKRRIRAIYTRTSPNSESKPKMNYMNRTTVLDSLLGKLDPYIT
jgi:hypothetical protein